MLANYTENNLSGSTNHNEESLNKSYDIDAKNAKIDYFKIILDYQKKNQEKIKKFCVQTEEQKIDLEF